MLKLEGGGGGGRRAHPAFDQVRIYLSFSKNFISLVAYAERHKNQQQAVCVVQMWGARLALLVEMQQYREAEVEMEAFGELVNPDLYYQYHTHNYPDKNGQLDTHTESLIIVVCCIQL